MRKKIRPFSKIQKHLFSALLSAVSMMAAVCISSVYSCVFGHLPFNCIPVFILFIILTSCNTADKLYGILCSFFSVSWLSLMYICPYFKSRLTKTGYLIDVSCTLVITVLISLLTFHLAEQADLASEAKEQLAEAEKEKMRANLLRAVSHDLRTPLTGITGNSLTYLESRDTLTDDEKNDIVRNIYEDSTWLVDMVENLLTITRIGEGDLTISTHEEPVEEVVAEALQKTETRHRGCAILVSAPEDLIMLPMDPILIEQVIINLLENALFHSCAGKPVELIVEDHPDCVSFAVRDYGKGIPKNILRHLFEGTGFTASAPGAKKGHGIGLVICKTIVAAHHGTITGRNHADGAEFVFTLPKGKEEQHESKNQYSSD